MKLFCNKEREFIYRHQSHKKYNKNLDKNVIYKFDHYPNSDDETFFDHRNRNRFNHFGRNKYANGNHGHRGKVFYYNKNKKVRKHNQEYSQNVASLLAEQIGKLE
jgi:hypothetical protein